MNTDCFNFDYSYLQLPSEFYTLTSPLPVSSPKTVIINHELATSLGIDLGKLSEEDKADFFSGHRIIPNTTPFCQAYAGHQYAHFTQLGDGRARWGKAICANDA